MKISAIICEFNPLHTGHKRLIDYAKSVSDKVVCIMSGNFTQRGLPACADKHSRAKHAVIAGADLVVELPIVFATASAENFAFGGVSIAKAIGADFLIFGSECGDVKELQKCATLLDDKNINEKIRQQLAQGYSYPRAVSTAMGTNTLSDPNNVLAVEYLRAINKLHANITPLTICRQNNYNSTAVAEYASSTALRQNDTLFDTYSFDFVKADVDPTIEQKFCNFVPYYLATVDANQMQQIEGVSEGIENRFLQANKSNGYNDMLEQIKNKRFSRAKLQRIALNTVLNVTAEIVQQQKDSPLPILPLAVAQNSVALLQKTGGAACKITQKADKLFQAFSGVTPPIKLQKI